MARPVTTPRNETQNLPLAIDSSDEGNPSNTMPKSAKKPRPRNARPSAPLEPCTSKCIHECTTKFTEDQRLAIFHKFSSFSYQQRDQFYAVSIRKLKTSPENLKRQKRAQKKAEKQGLPTKPPKQMFNYSLPDEKDKMITVCQKFYSSTTGFKRDSIGAAKRTVQSLRKGQVTKYKVGEYTHDESIIKRAAVEEDIMKNYKPQKSHYKRKQVCSVLDVLFLKVL